MQLDKTNISIRERGFGEIMGLALQVTRQHFAGLAMATVAGALPFALLNFWLLHELLASEFAWEEDIGFYWFSYLCLLVIETPFATGFVTLYLGQITFSNQVNAKLLVRDYFRALPQMIWVLGFLRCLMMGIFFMPYWNRPYLGELILLERTPLLSGKTRPITTHLRSGNLHSNNGGDLFGRWILICLVGILLWISLFLSVEQLSFMTASIQYSDFTWHGIVVPATLWCVVGWTAVVRFLAYLDLRIRHEGWEIELLMRAEAQRLRAGMAVHGA